MLCKPETPYPKDYEFFAQFILMPLVIIYLVILYLYGGKIIFQGHLPIGWVSNLILTFFCIWYSCVIIDLSIAK
ncbi:MAG: DUF4153 domain-containing protein [Bacteroidetes bacterium]|nr:DUF4153 domain-containing protein [Bacteroidota bacterium]